MARPKKRPELTDAKVTNSGHPKAPWRVTYTAERDSKPVRLRKAFANEDKAWVFAEERDREFSNYGARYGDFPPEARRALDYYRDKVVEFGKIGLEAPTFEELVSSSLASILHQHKEQAKEAEKLMTVAESVAIFTDYKQTRVGNRQLANLKDHLKRFAQEYGTRPMPSITTAEIDTWLSSLRSRKNPDKLTVPPLLGALSRNHYRATLHTFFRYAAAPARAWCDYNPVTDLEPERFTTEEPEAYTPEDVGKIMQTALDQKPELVPVLALGMFAGLRVSEAVEIDLGKLPKESDEFRTTGKTGPRMAPYTAACKAWLDAQPRRRGKAWQTSPRKLVDEMQDLYALAKVEQINNGARHSYISYRSAESRDIARIADECGNSVSMIKKHYRQLVTAEAANAFFAIRPTEAAENVTSIEQGRASA